MQKKIVLIIFPILILLALFVLPTNFAQATTVGPYVPSYSDTWSPGANESMEQSDPGYPYLWQNTSNDQVSDNKYTSISLPIGYGLSLRNNWFRF